MKWPICMRAATAAGSRVSGAEADLRATAEQLQSAQADLDAVIIATPTHLHKEMTLAALAAGVSSAKAAA